MVFNLILDKWAVFKITVRQKTYTVMALVYWELLLGRYAQNMVDFQTWEYPEQPGSGTMLHSCFWCLLLVRMLFGKERLIETCFVHSSPAMAHLQLSQAGLELCGAYPARAELLEQESELHSCAIAASYIPDNEHFAESESFLWSWNKCSLDMNNVSSCSFSS